MATFKKEQKNKKNPAETVTGELISKDRKQMIKILLVEDDFISQKVILSIIQRLGYSADIVSNGRDAVKALEQTAYDLVLMDCQMPEMNGYEATEEIRNPDSKVLDHRVPVIALTGHAMDGDMEKFTNAGMDDFLPKPVKPGELSDRVEKWILKHEHPKKKQSPVKTEGTGETVFDLSVLMGNLEDDKDLIRQILYDFYEYIPEKISALKKAYGRGDASSVRRQAHTIKGSSSNVGAVALQKIAHQIENAGESGDLTGIDSLLIRLDEQVAELKKVTGRL